MKILIQHPFPFIYLLTYLFLFLEVQIVAAQASRGIKAFLDFWFLANNLVLLKKDSGYSMAKRKYVKSSGGAVHQQPYLPSWEPQEWQNQRFWHGAIMARDVMGGNNYFLLRLKHPSTGRNGCQNDCKAGQEHMSGRSQCPRKNPLPHPTDCI